MTESRHAPPSKAQWAVEFPRAAWGVASLVPARAGLNAAPRGDGRPVMVMPGMFNTDRSTYVMRRFLENLGYDARGWGLGRNLTNRTIGADGERLFDAVAALREETGQPVTLIGVSLGGIMARLVAHRHPDIVREVITVASPYAGDPRATNVWRVFEMLTGDKVDSDAVIARRLEIAAPLPVAATAIWSRSDGFVNGMICHAPDEPGCRAIEVRSSHVGVQLRPQVLHAIAEVLAGSAQKKH
jgi:pimeloyl-ACP methyl ester carboxylesterase